ncbi:hypothetical protein HUB98_11235 [Paenibacillus barcinonensis]|uniref:Uncharacterized protein n=1 Tax=Paenibacillus barcinonensis TaxID=198119 RepID=A0A2V4WAN0_PAEBA|nr:hypothetical protein [Paenibacillus barcinonensis]PYE48317.1 hypothetical protein DFQ00_109171 [Paenibacillus barcinonensis]QKS56844.1 hypothetical protein HUB98_11235 [Paenibacillus barcinonensis]
MAAYMMQIHENVLQTHIPVKYIDVEVAYVGDGEGADVYVGAASNHGETYRYLFYVSAGPEAAGNHQVVHHLHVSSEVCVLKIFSNSSVPNHLVIRIYCRSGAGELIGVLSEHQMLKLAD